MPAVARAGRRTRSRPALAAFNGKVLELCTQALFVTLIPRALGPVDYGTLALALSAVTLSTAFLTLGNQSVMVRFVPAAPASERVALARRLVTHTVPYTVVLVIAGVVVAAVVVQVTSVSVPVLVASIVGIALLLDVVATRMCQAALGLGRTHAWAFRYALQNTIVIVAALAVAGRGGDVGTVTAVAVGSAAALVLGLAATADLWRRDPARPSSVEVPPGTRRFALLQGAASALTQFLFRAGALIVVAFGGSTREAGFAALALGAGLALTSIVAQAGTARMPGLVESWAVDRSRTVADAVLACGRSQLVVVPAAVLAVPAATIALPAIAGDAFRGAEPAFAPALAVIAFAPLLALSHQLTSLTLRPGVRAASAGVGALVFLATAAVTVPAWSAAGAAAAVLAGTAATVAVNVAVFPRVLTPRLLAPGVAGAVLALTAGWIV